jgi:hypothetical protein
MSMVQYEPEMFQDAVSHFRLTSITGGGGSSKPTFPSQGTVHAASVQSERVDRTDAAGRIFSVSRHEVYSPTLTDARTGDKIEWIGRVLAVEAATVPKGIGDVLWLTSCVETK